VVVNKQINWNNWRKLSIVIELNFVWVSHLLLENLSVLNQSFFVSKGKSILKLQELQQHQRAFAFYSQLCRLCVSSEKAVPYLFGIKTFRLKKSVLELKQSLSKRILLNLRLLWCKVTGVTPVTLLLMC